MCVHIICVDKSIITTYINYGNKMESKKITFSKRMTIELSDRLTFLLTSMAEENATTKIDVIRDAIALYAFINEEKKKAPGTKFMLIDEINKSEREIVLTP